MTLQSGARFDSPSGQTLVDVLNSLHPEYNARATLHNGEDEWVSLFGCVSAGFAISYKAAGKPDVLYCPKMIGLTEAQEALTGFLRDDPNWKTKLSWRRETASVRFLVKLLVVAAILSIIVFFVMDFIGW